MNIFIMFLVFIFMAGFYLIDSPNQKLPDQDIEEFIINAELKSNIECVKNSHIFNLKGTNFTDTCKDKYDIKNINFCINKNNIKMQCNGKQAYQLFITYSAPIIEKNYNTAAEIFEKYYKDIADFGILINKNLITGQRTYEPDNIIIKIIKEGSLLYFTKHKNQTKIKYLKPINVDLTQKCPKNTILTYKFGQYLCIEENKQFACIGDTICVPNYFNKPICGKDLTAVLINNIWECIDSTDKNIHINCETNQIKIYDNISLSYKCIEDPSKIKEIKKCQNINKILAYSKFGSTIEFQNISGSCNECEKQIINEETCESHCAPDETQLNNKNCYPDKDQCTGLTKGFYFGFPNYDYVKNIKELNKHQIPINKSYSQNRKFNCMDCKEKGINKEKSFYPFILVCN